jgi:hypothetical protein
VDVVTEPVPSHAPDAPDDSVPAGSRPPTLLVAIAIAGLEALAILAYTAGIALSGTQNPGSVAAPAVEALIYLVFAVGIVLVVKGLWQRRRWSRTPFVVIQLFALVTGWTLLQGDGDSTHLIGWAVLIVAVAGLVCAFLPRTGEALDL